MITITYHSEVDFEYISGSPQTMRWMAWGKDNATIQNSTKTNLCKWPQGLRNYEITRVVRSGNVPAKN